ncbi:protein adenylyltransferase SelO [Planktotalea sp.]|uniref:protein adenylyltransferase SelO n=1 Tax=Planktotalea sp. TaxID=2029877 RepID=UPI003298D439
MKTQIPFDNSFAALKGGFFTSQAPEVAPEPSLLAYNDALGTELGIEKGDARDLSAIFSGADVPSGAEPLAQLYAGHQFGSYNPQLGDGRAILLGEVIDTKGNRRDIQLKGSGRTPYSRGGDGKAWLGPILREYVVSEAMHALGIPTTRALAAVATGEQVYRETALPGAVLTRIAASHIRVGTFQIFAARGQIEQLQTLFEYTRTRHYPVADGVEGFLQAVMEAQCKLIPAWMGVGFIHGVMNTDNCQIAGETIDYGPCAFMDGFATDRVFSSIDRGARYSYGNQPDIVIWNMAQLATALVPLMPNADAAVTRFTEMLHGMKDKLRAEWLLVFAAKIGIAAPREGDGPLIADLLDMMETSGADFTNTFHALTQGSAKDQVIDQSAYQAWHDKWQTRLATENDPTAVMARANPAIIPRNHRIEQMIEAAVQGDFAPFHRLTAALATPFDVAEQDEDLTRPPSEQEIVPATFCGT